MESIGVLTNSSYSSVPNLHNSSGSIAGVVPSSTQASTTLSTYGTPAINLTTAPYSVPYSVPYSGPYSGPAYSPASLPSLLSGNSLGVTYSPQPLATVIGGIGVNQDLKPFPLGPDASPFFSFADLISALDIESLVHTLASSLRGTDPNALIQVRDAFCGWIVGAIYHYWQFDGGYWCFDNGNSHSISQIGLTNSIADGVHKFVVAKDQIFSLTCIINWGCSY